jgi:D-amino-acid dehydrogenase
VDIPDSIFLVERIELADGVIEPAEVVLAAGAWTPALGRSLGLGAVQPAKGYSTTLPSNTDTPNVPLRLGEDKMTITPVSDGRRLTGKLDLVGLRPTIDRRRIRDLQSHASRYVRIDALSDKATHWAGLRPLTPDGLPIIGRHHLVSNVILATGHGMLGIALAPLTGRVVGELVTGRPTLIDLSPYRSERFQNSA